MRILKPYLLKLFLSVFILLGMANFAHAQDVTGPIVTFSPATGATAVANTANITLTFDEAIKHIGGSEVTDANVASLISLRTTNVSGANIAFSATIDTDKKVITIDPISNFTSEQVVYVAIGTSFEDASGNTNSAANATFTAADSAAPIITFSPATGATAVANGSNITLTFNEAIRLVDDSALTDTNVDALITLKTDDASGSDISFDATIDTDKKVITINPDSNFTSEQVVYVAIGTSVEDASDNAISAANATFTAADSAAPTITFSPATGATAVANGSNITLTFNEAIRLVDDSALTDTNVDALITLKTDDASGSDISFDATIDTDKKVITINPDSNFTSEQVVYVAIGTSVEDASDNAISAANATFTAADSAAPTITFSPATGATAVANGSNITLTFNEAIRLVDDSALTNTNVDALITLKTDDASGSDISFDATIDTDKKVITINPDSNFTSEQVVYVAIGTSVEDASDNAISAANATFTAADSAAPIITFSPATGATAVANDSTITLTFSEAIRLVDDSALTNTNVDALITLKTDDASGSVIGFDAIINANKTVITVIPTNNFSSEQVVYVAIGTSVEDASDNAISAANATFTAADTAAPTITFSPATGATAVANDSNITLTFNEAIRLVDDTVLTDTNVDALITLKTDDASGAVIGFDATINANKTVITINPDSNFTSEQVVYVAIGASVEDTLDNAISAANATFTAADSVAPTITFSPATGATAVANGSNITLTFNEAIRLVDDTVLTDTNVDALITLKTDDASGSDISFDATIDTDKKVITINPDSNFTSEQVVYVAIGTSVEDASDNAISAANATFTAADSAAPTITFSPATGATAVANGSNITLTFNEAIRLVDDSALTDTNVDALITLKTDDASGSDISFDATIDTDKKVITINPDSNFTSEQVVYVAIGTSVEDASDNAISAANATFTAADSAAPTITFSPATGATAVANGSNITLTFNEAIRLVDDSALTDTNVDALITLKTDDASGSDISFDATIDTDKKVITINPDSNFTSEQVVYVAIGTSVEDASDNAISAANATFTAADSAAPIITFSPATGATAVANGSNITLTFNEAIRLVDDSALTNTNVDALITLKTDDASGSDISFDATIDTDKKVITINPDSNFTSEQVVYVAIGATVEDASDNAISAANATFTAADSVAPTITFSPATGATAVANGSNITLTFNEAIRLVDDSALTDTNVDALITLKTDDASGAVIGFDATIDTDKKVITINPDSNFTSEQVVYVAIGTSVEDASDNAISAANATFTAADTAAPTITFSPATGATAVANGSNITLTFNEAIRLVDDSALTNTNVDALITLKTDDASGSDISFDATIDTDKKVITINPDSNFTSEQVVYVAIGTSVEDASDNAISAANATFTAADSVAPTITFSPATGATAVANGSNITLTFNEAIRLVDDSALTDTNVDALITLKTDDASGSDISFDATIDTDKKVITINPDSNFTSEQVVYVAIGTSVEDASDNAISAANATFTAADSAAPTITFSPATGATAVANGSNITLTFNEAIRLVDDSALTDTNVDALITLKTDDASGSDISFDATIDTDKKVITINPDSNFTSEQVVYVAIGTSVEDASDNAISAANATFTAADSAAPTITFSPATGATAVANGSNITLTFNEAIRLVDDSALTDTNVDALITLTADDASGSDISFDATIDTDKKVITINPDSNFTSEQVVYVAIGATVEDASDNAISAANATFTAADSVAPTITFSPATGATAVANGSNITLTFNEAIRLVDDSALTDTNVDALITLKTDDASGSDISFDATIDTDKKVITINPDSNFTSEQVVYVAIGTSVEDASDNAISAANATFTAADSAAPTITFSPATGATAVANGSNITLTFNEAIRLVDDSALTDTNVDALITLKTDDASGSDISFDATIDTDKKVITINPDSNFTSEQVVYVAIGTSVEDASDNAISAANATFTAADSVAPTITFSPATGATAVANGSNITLTFNEAIRLVDDSALTDTNVDALITLKTDDASGSDISFDATIDTDKKVITINPDSNFTSEQVVYVAIGTSVEDASDNAISAANATFTAADSAAPTITFSPATGATAVANDSTITLTFNEAIRLVDDSALTNTNVDALITLTADDASGAVIGFDAIIDTDKKVITVIPTSDFTSEQVVYVAIGTSVEDASDNAISAANATFTAADTAAPTITFSPATGATAVANGSNITLTFNEAIRLVDDTVLTNTNVDALITLKTDDASGSDISFDATIDTDKKVITINPDSNFTSEQVVYVAIGTSVEDASDNAISAANATFTAADSVAPTITFSPATGATAVANGSNITLTFNEAIRLVDDSALTDTNVDALITLKTDDASGSDISFDATIDTDKKVITINPDSNFTSEQVVYVAIGTSVEDASDNAISAANATFTAADSAAPTITFSPATGATAVANGSNITLTFNEAIRLVDDSALTDTNVDALITLKTDDASGSDISFDATIDTDKKVITINPDSNFTSEQVVYVAIGTSVEDASDNAISAANATFTAADSVAPTITFSPATGATAVANDSNITLTFNEAIRLVDDSALTDTNVDALITLKTDDASGSDISFDATIDTDKKVITINPDSNFTSEQVVYVAIGASVEDASDNAISAANATFTAKESVAPTITFSPATGATAVANGSNITLTFNEAIRLVDDSALTDTNVDALITLKTDDASGSDISFDATIDTDKKVITINPDSNFTSEQVVYVAIGTSVEDASDNAISAANATFTAADTAAPTITFSPATGATAVANGSNITLTFNEAIRLVDDSALTDTNVDALITLKTDDASGSDISFDATIDTDKKVITINPDSNFTSEQVVYVAIGTSVEDTLDNAISAANATFTAADSVAPTITFSPATGATAVANGSNITLTFNEAIRLVDDSALTDTNVDALITLKTDDASGSDISFDATIDTDKKVITINPDSNFTSEQVVYVAIGTSVEDASDNAISAANATFTAADSAAPTITFSPATGATAVANGSNITLTFNEAIRLVDDSALTDTNVDALITLKTDDASGAVIGFDATIDTDKKVITINPDSNFTSEQVVYVAIGTSVEDASDNAISAANATFTAADTAAPTITFSPATGATAVANGSNITLTFNEAIRLVDDSALTNTNVDALITLKTDDASGSDISFDATIDTDKKVITINPDSNFTSEQVVYVAIGATVEDASDNAISAANATFTAADSVAPTITFSPATGATAVANGSNITLTFNEAIRLVDDSALTDTNVDALITLKTDDASGSDISFDATIDTDKKVITINPDSNFTSEQVVYVAIGTSVEDASDNAISAANATFTAADSAAPTITFSPATGATAVANGSNITLTFNEAIRLVDDSALTDTNVDALITLKTDDASGSDISFDATIDTDKKVITINPDSNFTSEQVVYVAIGTSVEDASDNAISAANATFTAADSVAPTITFSPATGATAVANGSNITLTFNEAIRLVDDSALTDTNVDALITLKTDDASGADISFDATIDTDKKVITINPDSNFTSEQVVYVAIGTSVEDASDNAISAANATFTAADSVAPTITFSPATGATAVANGSNITLTFNEAIRLVDDSALTDTNVDALITLKTDDASGSDISFDATIDTDKKVITINPDSNFTSEQVVYVAIGTSVEDASDNAISAANATFTAADTAAPTITFSPATGATAVANGSNITLTFNEAIRLVDDSALTNTNVDALITLKTDDASGAVIGFDATIDTDKKVITINPDSNFTSEQVVYVAIGTSVEDASDNAISAANATFTAADSVAPTITFSPATGATAVANGSNITLTFNEAIRLVDDSALTDTNVDALITLKTDDASGADISFDATIDTDKKVITINPDSNFTSEQVVYVAIGTSVEDASDNAISAANATFTAADSAAPTITFSPATGATAVANGSNITLTFNEAIRLVDDSALTDTNVDALITLKTDDASGSDISFDATIDTDKKVITINPDSDFSSEQVVYVAIGTSVEDASDNAISAANATFTAKESAAPTITFSPATGATAVANGSNITLTFNEAIRLVDDSALTDTNVDALITLKTDDASGAVIGFDATIDTDKKVITINPDSNFTSEQVVYVAIGATVEDASDNAISAANATFTAKESVAPTITFSPATGATAVANGSNITLTFNEAIRLVDDSALTNTNVDALITLKTDDASGAVIGFDATIDTDKKVITINPDSNFTSEQVVYVAIGATVEDASDNAISAANATFTVKESVAPTVTFSPAHSATGVANDSNITLTFNEAIRLVDDSALTDTNVDALITLKTDDASGSDISFDATIDTDKKVITINPDSNFTSEQVVYVAIGTSVEDASDNAISAANATFTAAATPAAEFAKIKADVESKMAANARTQLNDFTSSTSSIVGSARSRFMNTPSVADSSDTALNGDVSSDSSNLNASSKRVTSSDDGKATSIIEVQYQYTETKEGLKSQNASGQIINERKLSDSLTFGRFLGATLGDAEAVGTNNTIIDFMSAQAGAYLLANTTSGLVYDTYFAGSIIENNMGVTNSKLTANSKYYSSMFTTGASITASIQAKRFEIRPRLSAEYGYMFGETADFNVKVGSATSVEQASYQAITQTQITFAPEFRLPFTFDGSLLDESSAFTFTPNVKCRGVKQGTVTTECGQGLSLGLKVNNRDGLNNFTAKAGMDRIGGQTTSTFNLMFEKKF